MVIKLIFNFVLPKRNRDFLEFESKPYFSDSVSVWNLKLLQFILGYAQIRQDIQVQDSLFDVKRVEFHKAYLASLARAIR